FRCCGGGHILGHKCGKRNTHPNTSHIQIEGASNKEDAQFYLRKWIANIYRARERCAWYESLGDLIDRRVTHLHGNSAVVKSKFRSNLPPHCFGASVHIMIYPGNI
ncbi:ribosomal protein L35Ae, partial [Ramaria rubella]